MQLVALRTEFLPIPTDSCRCSKCIAAIKRKDWQPSEYSLVCSAHFVSGKKSNDPLSPDFVPNVLTYMHSPHKQKNKAEV